MFVSVIVMLLLFANNSALLLPSSKLAPSGTVTSTVKSKDHSASSSRPATDLVTVKDPYLGSSIFVFVNVALATASEEITPVLPFASTVYSSFVTSVTV